jgi:hypothetical protein
MLAYPGTAAGGSQIPSGSPGGPPAPSTNRADGGALRTEFPFSLPRGYVDEQGTVHRDGVMRLATARDEIQPLRDPRVRENEAYLTVILLSRVVTRLGTLAQVNPSIVEGMFASDLAFLQDLYRRVNREGTAQAAVTCPSCRHEFAVEMGGGSPGES